MTWPKYGTEYFDQLVDFDFPDDLDDACQLTHTQAIAYVYSVEAMDLRFKKSVLSRFATSKKSREAAAALVTFGAWADRGREWEVVHHADVVRQSLGYQLKERRRAKEAMQRKRARESVVTPDVTRNDVRTQTDSHTDSSSGGRSSEWVHPATGEVRSDDPWADRCRLHGTDYQPAACYTCQQIGRSAA